MLNHINLQKSNGQILKYLTLTWFQWWVVLVLPGSVGMAPQPVKIDTDRPDLVGTEVPTTSFFIFYKFIKNIFKKYCEM
jgi:hypothetical protein